MSEQLSKLIENFNVSHGTTTPSSKAQIISDEVSSEQFAYHKQRKYIAKATTAQTEQIKLGIKAVDEE